MGPEVVNRNKNCVFNGPYAGRDLYITMYQDNEREFVVTHNANIKPVAYFTGRETELQDLRQRIEEGCKSVLVSGMGGIGKTHICRKLFEEYLNKHAEDENGPFRHLGYIEYSGDMGSSLQSCLKFKQQDSPEQNQEAAWRELEYLAADGKLLLFVDNVDKPTSADPGLQKLKEIPGAIVLTSRQASFGDEFEPYRIGFLGMEQCKEIYEKIRYRESSRRVDPEEIPDLEYVIEALAGRHTITVEFLAHLARTKLWTVKRLRDELEEKGFRLTFHKAGELVNIQESYEKLYDLSELTGAEQNILEAFSVFPYIPLAAETCNKWLLADAGASEGDDILMGLYQKGWLQFDLEHESYALHPVFAQFIYEKCKPNAKGHEKLIKYCESCLKIHDYRLAIEIAHFAENIVEKMGIKNIVLRDDFTSGFYNCLKVPDGESIPEYAMFLPFAENIYEKSNIDKGDSWIEFIRSLAKLFIDISEYKKAEKWFEENLKIQENLLGKNHLDITEDYDNLGYVYQIQGRYTKAEEFYEKALRIRGYVLGENHLDTAKSYINLAEVFARQEQYTKAEVFYKEGLRIRVCLLGENHLDTASGYNFLAYIYECQEKYEMAEKLYKKCLKIRKNLAGEEHRVIADSYDVLACINAKQGKYGKAIIFYEKSLEIQKKVMGENHQDTACLYNNQAYVYLQKEDYINAKELYERALKIQKSILGEDHLDTATSYMNLGYVYSCQEEYRMALIYYYKAYRIISSKLDLNHPFMWMTSRGMKNVYLKLNPEGNFEQWLEDRLRKFD